MKLVEVMACVDRVAKNGNNTAQGYKYAMAADVYDAVRGELARRFVLPVPRMETIEFADAPTKAGGVLHLCTWKGFIDFTDAESGEVLPVRAFGQGSDSSDKAGYKATTGATKQALVQLFLIPTGDDPENEKATKPQPPPPAGLAGVKAKMPPPSAPPAASSVRASHDRALVYPFGNCKGHAIGAVGLDGGYVVDEKSLLFWVGNLQKGLSDPSKAKWHERDAKQIATLQAEIRFRNASQVPVPLGTDGADEPPPLDDNDAPPPF